MLVQNPTYRKITKGQLGQIHSTPQQNLSDCYLVASLKALAKSNFGEKMLKNSIQSADGKVYKIRFNKFGDETYLEKFDSAYKNNSQRKNFNIMGAVESAFKQLLERHSSAKPFFLRFSKSIENNTASKFMEVLTGKKPISLGDNCIGSLNRTPKKAVALLDAIADKPMDKHSFVAGSNLFITEKGVADQHYFVIKKVDKAKKKVYLMNPRYTELNSKEDYREYVENVSCKSQKSFNTLMEKLPREKVLCLDYDKFMKNFRSIVGYFE